MSVDGLRGLSTPSPNFTVRPMRGRGRSKTPQTTTTPGSMGWGEATPPPSYPGGNSGRSLGSLIHQLDILVGNLSDNCSLLEATLTQGINESQAFMFANTLGEGLQAIERQEFTIVGEEGSRTEEHLAASRILKARARRLLLLCHAQINPRELSRGSDRGGLPKLKLPVFDGQISQWRNYWQLFRSLVDSRKDLPPIEKFNYLLQSLTNEPLNSIKGILVSEENYPTALSLLQQKYGNADKIKQVLFQQFRELKAPKHSLHELTIFNSAVEQLITQITGPHPSEDLEDCIKSLIAEKLAPQTCDLIAIRLQRCTYTLAELREGIQFVIDMFEFNSIKSGETTIVNTVADRAPNNRNQASARLPLKNQNTFKRQCQLCAGDHRVQECTKFTTRDNIRDQANRLHLCYNCFSSKHRATACPSRYSCRNCHNRHHTLLCPGVGIQGENQTQRRRFENPVQPTNPSSLNTRVVQDAFSNPVNPLNNAYNASSSRNTVVIDNPTNVSQNNQTNLSNNAHVSVSRFNCNNVSDLPAAVMPIAKLKVSYGNERCLTRALIDSGSQKSFISHSLAKRLNLPVVSKVCLNLSTFGSENTIQEFEVVKAKLQLGKVKITVKFIVHENVNTTIHNPGIIQIQEKFKQKGVMMADRHITSEVINDVELLIGVDYFGKIILSQRKICGVNTFITHVGVIPYGTLPSWALERASSSTFTCHRVICAPVISNQFNETQYWEMQTIGIKDERYTVDEKQAVEQITTEMRKTEKGYCIKLPFKPNERPSINYRNAIAQLNSLVVKFQKQVNLYEQYNKVIQDYLAKDFIEEVHHDDMSGCYLPHHPVFKESATTPIRIVFNASSKPAGGKSLNDCLFVGPSLTQRLHDALVRFRKDPIAVIADISKAFHRVIIDESHRKFTKFVWVDSCRDNKVVYQFKVVIFGACCSPYILQQVILTHLSNPQIEIPELASNFYVDNLFRTYENLEVAIKEKNIIDNIMNDASMPLQGWISNNSEFNNKFEIVVEQMQHMLGMKWDILTDKLSLNHSKKFPRSLDSWKPTKRNFVAALASIFDPLGLVGPVTVSAKLYVQYLWRQNYQWDESLNPEDQIQARKLLSNLQNTDSIEFPRNIINNECSLQVFSDASSRAYGVVCYTYDSSSSNILISKQRVAPCNKKTLTIPKLELTGILIGCRLIRHLLQLFSFSCTKIWTDSKVAIAWIQSKKDLKDIYVSNRVREIRDLLESFHINLGYVNTSLNPADLLTKGCQLSYLQNCQLWMHGPSLCDIENLNCVENVSMNEIIVEIHPQPATSPLFSLDRITSYTKVHNIFFFIIKFTKLNVTPLELIAKQEQLLHTPSLHSYVKNHRVKVTPDIIQTANHLNLILEKGLMKCYTRLQHSDLDQQTHTPIFIPRASKLVKLFVIHLHTKHRHCSVSQTLTYYRQYAWTPKLRTVISFLLRRCVVCQLLRRPTKPRPPPPPLPENRVAYIRPFSSVGVDNTSSFRVRGTLEGRRYLTLFVCTTTRYVHIEVSSSLSTEDFLHAFRRFIAQYGIPNRVLSDNGRNFVGAERCLATASKSREFQHYLHSNGIEWRFQTPRSPWKGGHFERMVSLLKSSLVVSLRHKLLNEEQFRTAVAEAQAVVNSRPLTYLSNDLDDEALTPAHLIRGTLAVTLPIIEVVPEVEGEPGRRLRHQHTLLMQSLRTFRERWMKEYLTSLQTRHYNCCVTDTSHQPRAGDLVLLQHADIARYAWPLARILEVYPDERGTVRSALVKCRDETYLRSIEHLVPLELCCERQLQQSQSTEEKASEEGSSPPQSEATAEVENPGREEDASTPVSDSTREGEAVLVPLNPTHGDNPPDETEQFRVSRRVSRPLRQAATQSRQLLQELIHQRQV